ncbi:MAG: HAMP domain-containing histidine kinase [Oscillospiraceae bacterium]|nr:HAMP domain-containing histidine kinase [Oscillospiraceae bacterium]
MSKLKGSLAAKIIAIILLAMCCLVLCGTIIGIAWLDSEGAYHDTSAESVRTAYIDSRLQRASIELLDRMQAIPVRSAYDSTVRFELLDEKGNVLAGNFSDKEAVEHSLSFGVPLYFDELYFTAEDQPLTAWDYRQNGGLRAEVTPTPVPVPTGTPVSTGEGEEAADEAAHPEGTKVWTMRLYWTEASESTEADMTVRIYEQLYPFRYSLIAVGAISLLLAVLLFVFLMAAAGHHDASGEVKAGVIEKIPFDVLLIICIAGVCILIMIIGETFSSRQIVLSFMIAAICLVGAGLLTLLCLMSAAVRLKLKTLLSSCLIWRVLSWGWKWLKKVFCAAADLFHGIPLVWKWIPVYAVLLIVDFSLTFTFRRDYDMLGFVLLLRWALIAAAILYVVLCLRRLRNGTKAIATGEESVVIDTNNMVGDFKAQADDLMHIRDGLSRAVDERMRSERLRTELITNVSHDIKTPLTSIINYVDLLSREELPEGNAAEYVEVLKRQSARLKKLTDDLVEASKASTGNLPVTLEQLDLGVLTDQIQGEYGERLAEKKLELIITKPEKPVHVQADPRHLWRVLDNLMTNILKYAMPGTRVYYTLECENNRPKLCLRNISAEALNVRPEELTERFVRGDSARSTEGSGLGLAIASSLCKLQNIEMSLSIDGDLFKVSLLFPSLPETGN